MGTLYCENINHKLGTSRISHLLESGSIGEETLSQFVVLHENMFFCLGWNDIEVNGCDESGYVSRCDVFLD